MRRCLTITAVEIGLITNSRSRLLAFATITFEDCFVLKDVKIVRGEKRLIISMPSRKLTDRCPGCHRSNNLEARYCSHCGSRLAEKRGQLGRNGKMILHQDVAHPLDQECRFEIEQAVLKAYTLELERAKIPGYKAPIRPADTSGELPAVEP